MFRLTSAAAPVWSAPCAHGPADSPLLDLASNDYLGLAGHPDVTRAAAEAATRWGAGATGSRLVAETIGLHAALEAERADFAGFEAAPVFSDRHNHAWLIAGCRLSRAQAVIVPHADPAAAARALEHRDGRAVVVTESVFSVDGDVMPLAGRPSLLPCERRSHVFGASVRAGAASSQVPTTPERTLQPRRPCRPSWLKGRKAMP